MAYALVSVYCFAVAYVGFRHRQRLVAWSSRLHSETYSRLAVAVVTWAFLGFGLLLLVMLLLRVLVPER